MPKPQAVIKMTPAHMLQLRQIIQRGIGRQHLQQRLIGLFVRPAGRKHLRQIPSLLLQERIGLARGKQRIQDRLLPPAVQSRRPR